jgi:hypothetical protein
MLKEVYSILSKYNIIIVGNFCQAINTTSRIIKLNLEINNIYVYFPIIINIRLLDLINNNWKVNIIMNNTDSNYLLFYQTCKLIYNFKPCDINSNLYNLFYTILKTYGSKNSLIQSILKYGLNENHISYSKNDLNIVKLFSTFLQLLYLEYLTDINKSIINKITFLNNIKINSGTIKSIIHNNINLYLLLFSFY